MDMMIDYTNLIETSAKRIRNTKETFIRSIDKKINWKSRLIGIKGARGCGKTTLLLQHLKNNHMDLVSSGKALYVSLDNIWFAKNSLLDLVETFTKNGGKILYLDEVHRYEDWPIYIKNISRLWFGVRRYSCRRGNTAPRTVKVIDLKFRFFRQITIDQGFQHVDGVPADLAVILYIQIPIQELVAQAVAPTDYRKIFRDAKPKSIEGMRQHIGDSFAAGNYSSDVIFEQILQCFNSIIGVQIIYCARKKSEFFLCRKFFHCLLASESIMIGRFEINGQMSYPAMSCLIKSIDC